MNSLSYVLSMHDFHWLMFNLENIFKLLRVVIGVRFHCWESYNEFANDNIVYMNLFKSEFTSHQSLFLYKYLAYTKYCVE